MEQGTLGFGPFRLDPAKRLLWREGALVALAPKAVDLLLALVEKAGEVMSKQELMDRVWPDTFVEEANLSVHVATIRKALGEDATYIDTVARRGYRFVAPVARRGRLRLAVLPFRTLGTAKDAAYLGLGLADALITRLVSSGPVSVSPTRAVQKYADGTADAERAGRELQVDAVLDGTVQMDGTRVLVNVQMVPMGGATAAWADRFQAERTSVFDLQNAIAERVAQALEFRLGDGKPKRPRVDFEAYQSYVKGRYFWSRLSPAEMEKAFACFEDAARRDPAFALPHAGLAEAYLMAALLGVGPTSIVWSRAQASAQRALALDDSLAEAHISLGVIAMFRSRDWQTAARELEAGMERNPGTASAHQWYAVYLHIMGRFAEAQRELQHALELEPLSIPVHAQMALQGYLSGDHAEELRACETAVELEPNQFLPRWSLGMAYANLGRYDDALREHERAVDLSGGIGTLRASVARTLAQAGRTAEARAVLDARPSSPLGAISPYARVSALVALGDEKQALTDLERAAKNGDPWIVWMKVDPMLAPLRTQPRFAAVLRSVFGEEYSTKKSLEP
jgi:DNA-binding winged helix-turn-helix (wHTH) protein/tetratricopeptide (TPR) repeat protein